MFVDFKAVFDNKNGRNYEILEKKKINRRIIGGLEKI